MEGYWHDVGDAMRWKRIHRMRDRLPNIRLSALTADCAWHICVIMNPEIAGIGAKAAIERALDTLEAQIGGFDE